MSLFTFSPELPDTVTATARVPADVKKMLDKLDTVLEHYCEEERAMNRPAEAARTERIWTKVRPYILAGPSLIEAAVFSKRSLVKTADDDEYGFSGEILRLSAALDLHKKGDA